MGHEVGMNGTVLEEGCAEYHSRQFTGDNTGNYGWHSQGEKYKEAGDAVDSLLKKYGPNKFIELRKIEPYLSKVTIEQLLEVFPDIDLDLAAKLSANFYDKK